VQRCLSLPLLSQYLLAAATPETGTEVKVKFIAVINKCEAESAFGGDVREVIQMPLLY
jgi:hypothetical protein